MGDGRGEVGRSTVGDSSSGVSSSPSSPPWPWLSVSPSCDVLDEPVGEEEMSWGPSSSLPTIYTTINKNSIQYNGDAGFEKRNSRMSDLPLTTRHIQHEHK